MIGSRWLQMAFRAAVPVVVAMGLALFAPGVMPSDRRGNAGLIPSIPPSVTVTKALGPHFSSAPTVLDFGAVEVRSGKELPAMMINDGTVGTDVSAVQPPEDSLIKPFRFVRFSECGVVYVFGNPGGTCAFSFAFMPSSPGVVNVMTDFRVTYGGGVYTQTVVLKLTGCGLAAGTSCPAQPTPTPSPSRATTADPASAGVQPAPVITTVTTIIGGAPPPPSSTVDPGPVALAGGPHSSEGPNVALVVVMTAGIAVFGTLIAGLLILRWRWLLSKVRSRGGQVPRS